MGWAFQYCTDSTPVYLGLKMAHGIICRSKNKFSDMKILMMVLGIFQGRWSTAHSASSLSNASLDKFPFNIVAEKSWYLNFPSLPGIFYPCSNLQINSRAGKNAIITYCQSLTCRFLQLWLINSTQDDLECVFTGDVGAIQGNTAGLVTQREKVAFG